jgi:hypothetical protein
MGVISGLEDVAVDEGSQGLRSDEPTISVADDRTVTVGNLLVSLSSNNRIQAIFRCPTGADYKLIYEIMNDRNYQSDAKLLSKLCIQWGEDSTVSMGELLGQDMPLGSLLWLVNKVVLEQFLRLG